MNNKGQTLVIFVVVLPLLLLIIASVIDINLMYSEKNKLDNLNMMVTSYGLDNISENNIEEKTRILINKNDKEIKIKNITIEENKITKKIKKNIKSVFGKIIGIKKYQITSKYIGTNYNKDKEIKKG